MDLRTFSEMQQAYNAHAGEQLMDMATTFVPTVALTREELGKTIFFLMELNKYYRQKIIPREQRELLDNLIDLLQAKTVTT